VGDYLIGAAARVVTPPQALLNDGRIFTWGFGANTNVVSAVRDPLWSRALVISDADSTSVVLISVDIGALAEGTTGRVRAAVLAALGVPGEYVLIGVTHTHSAPVTVTLPVWPGQLGQPDAEYMEFLEGQIIGSVTDAFTGQRSGTLEFARGLTSIGYNRHLIGGVYDQTLDVLKATDDGGATIAVAFFHGCHAVCVNNPSGNAGLEGLSSDWPGEARGVVEEAVGGLAFFFQGYAGTIDPAGRAAGVYDAHWTGATIGDDVVGLATGPMEFLAGPVDALAHTIELPLQNLSPAALTEASKDSRLLKWVAYMQSLGAAAPGTLPTELQVIRVGRPPQEWRVLACAHEPAAEFASPVRALWPDDRVTLAGYSNCQRSYLPNSWVLANPACALPPVCEKNYEGAWSFAAVYAHRAPLTSAVDGLLLDGDRWLNGVGVHYAALWQESGAVAWEAHHGLSRDAFQSHFDDLSTRGYRLADWSGYRVAGQDRYSDVWVADSSGLQWQAWYGTDAGGYQTKFNELKAQGYRPTRVFGYRAGNEELYGGIWELRDGPALESRHGLSAADYQLAVNDLSARGYRPVYVSAFEGNTGERFCMIWEDGALSPWELRHGMTSDQFQSEFNARLADGFRLIHFCGYTVRAEDRYVAIWEQSPGPGWEARHGLTSCAYQQSFNALRDRYIPIAVSGYRAGG